MGRLQKPLTQWTNIDKQLDKKLYSVRAAKWCITIRRIDICRKVYRVLIKKQMLFFIS